MNKQHYLYGLIGLLVGSMAGYFGTDYLNGNATNGANAVKQSLTAQPSAQNESVTGGAQNSSNSSGGPQAEVATTIEQARRQPANFEAQMKAANLFKQINRSEGAIEFYESAARIKPNDFNLLVTLGDTNFDLKRFEEAGKWYNQALKINPNSATVWMDLGSSYYLRQPRSPSNLDQAITAYRAAIKSDPRSEKSLQNLTQALIEKGDKAAAQESLKQLEQVNPGNQTIGQLRSKLN